MDDIISLISSTTLNDVRLSPLPVNNHYVAFLHATENLALQKGAILHRDPEAPSFEELLDTIIDRLGGNDMLQYYSEADVCSIIADMFIDQDVRRLRMALARHYMEKIGDGFLLSGNDSRDDLNALIVRYEGMLTGFMMEFTIDDRARLDNLNNILRNLEYCVSTSQNE